jgi:hypothetical protein
MRICMVTYGDSRIRLCTNTLGNDPEDCARPEVGEGEKQDEEDEADGE